LKFYENYKFVKKTLEISSQFTSQGKCKKQAATKRWERKHGRRKKGMGKNLGEWA